MPICQFSGARNWGYDGVFPFAVQNTYGTPNDLKALVDACHQSGVALFIDLVYNHIGPEGNCLNDYAPYFPQTNNIGRWGPRINLDGPEADGVRNYFLQNALHWLSRYHIDGIRLDAVLAMPNNSPQHFLQELSQTVKQYSEEVGKKLHLIAELGKSYNEPKILTPFAQGGFEFDAQWLEDFHHSLFTLLTGEKEGYYKNYGSLRDLNEALADGYIYLGKDGGEIDFRRRTSGESYSWIPAYKFIVFSQNHDQVGNRLLGDRLVSIAGFEAAKLAAGMILLSPYIPLLFMGEEYGETSPFLFFVDYSDNELKNAVRTGRKKEFADFQWDGEVPDPQSIETFDKSKINWQLRYSERGKKIVSFYRTLIQLRKKLPLFHSKANRQIEYLKSQNEKTLFIKKQNDVSEAGVIANFAAQQSAYNFPFENGAYLKILDSSDAAWGGLGSLIPETAVEGDQHVAQPFSVAIFFSSKEGEKSE
jgi:maltooligosyltrehalose trehalohydrolase